MPGSGSLPRTHGVYHPVPVIMDGRKRLKNLRNRRNMRPLCPAISSRGCRGSQGMARREQSENGERPRLELPEQPRLRATLHRAGAGDPPARSGGAGEDHPAGGTADRRRPGEGRISLAGPRGPAEPLRTSRRSTVPPPGRGAPRHQFTPRPDPGGGHSGQDRADELRLAGGSVRRARLGGQ